MYFLYKKQMNMNYVTACVFVYFVSEAEVYLFIDILLKYMWTERIEDGLDCLWLLY